FDCPDGSSLTCSSELNIQPLGGHILIHNDGGFATLTCDGNLQDSGGGIELRASSSGNLAAVFNGNTTIGDMEVNASSNGNIAATFNGNTVIGDSSHVTATTADPGTTLSLEFGAQSTLRGSGVIALNRGSGTVCTMVCHGAVSPGAS